MATKPKILYVDDEPINVINFTMSFEDDFEILGAESGQEALDLFRSQRPSVIIADQRMPGMTGVELLTQIYSEDPDPVRIILTAFSDFNDIIVAINEGHIYQFCQKPWNISELRLTILRAVEKFSMTKQNKMLLSELELKNKMLSTANLQLAEDLKTRETLERKRCEAEIKMLAQAKLASLGEIATGIAHEVNQPLTYINVMLQSTARDLQENTLNVEELRDDVSESQRQVFRITKIIDHLRTFGRSEASEFTKLSLPDVLENALTLLRKRLHSNHIILQQEDEPDLPLIKGNSTQLEQMFINLVQNSVDALKNKKERRISVLFHKKGDEIIITYSDNGEGMAEVVADKIFEPFFTTKEIGKGTGLGMSIVHGIVHVHNGTIKCDSSPGRGTTFTISLPTSCN